MHIAGPFLDPQRKRAKKKWFLRYFAAEENPDGSPKLNEHGHAVKKKRRPYYETKDAAVADKTRLETQHATAGTGTAGVLSRAQLEDYEQARREVAEIPLLELARFWRVHHPRSATATVAELVPQFRTWVESRLGKTRHLEDLKSRLHLFGGKFGERLPATITRAEFLDYLLSLGKAGRTVLNQKRAVVNFFNWLVDDAKVLATNPLAGIKKRALPKDVPKEIAFLSLVAVNRYLRAAERYDPDLVAHEIIQLVSGVRADDEMSDFQGEFVKVETREVVIPAEIAKTERREVIQHLEENFWAWWQAYGRQGILRPANYLQRWHRVRVLAEIEDRAQADERARLPIKILLKTREAAAALHAWPWNARRRTFCTYHVAKYGSADKTALILRHRGEASTLHNSYRGTGVTREQGAAFFAITPAPVPRVISPARPARGIVRLQLTRPKKAPAAASVA
jgi:hypothetical protein